MGLNKEEIDLAVRVFNKNVALIHTVEEWSSFMNFNRPKTFSRHVKIYFGKSAIKVMTDLRINKIKELMRTFPEESLFCIARLVGLKDEKSLYDYIKYHKNLSPTSLKNSLETAKFRNEITEYNLGVKIQSHFTE